MGWPQSSPLWGAGLGLQGTWASSLRSDVTSLRVGLRVLHQGRGPNAPTETVEGTPPHQAWRWTGLSGRAWEASPAPAPGTRPAELTEHPHVQAEPLRTCRGHRDLGVRYSCHGEDAAGPDGADGPGTVRARGPRGDSKPRGAPPRTPLIHTSRAHGSRCPAPTGQDSVRQHSMAGTCGALGLG